MLVIVDFHSHFFSRTFFETLAQASPLPGSPDQRLESVAQGLGLALPSADPLEHLARWIGELDKHGVRHLVTFASVAEELSVLARVLPAASGRLSALALVDPRAAGAPERLRRAIEEEGFSGALFFPVLHRYRLDGPEFAAALAVLAERRLPAVVHCGLLRIPLRERFGLARAQDLRFGDPLSLAPAAAQHPHVPIVVPHFGAGFLRETLLLGAQCENVHVDTSSSHSWLATQPQPTTLVDVFERVLGVFGPERVLFGTDSSTFPRGWRRDLFLAQREALGALGMGEEDRARIFGGNAERLLAGAPRAVQAPLAGARSTPAP
jgi:predicted TIM-barrel fold metal-dependent hydrolase